MEQAYDGSPSLSCHKIGHRDTRYEFADAFPTFSYVVDVCLADSCLPHCRHQAAAQSCSVYTTSSPHLPILLDMRTALILNAILFLIPLMQHVILISRSFIIVSYICTGVIVTHLYEASIVEHFHSMPRESEPYCKSVFYLL